MTVAVCLVCGERKFGAFLPCAACDWEPIDDEDRVRSTLLTDHYQPEEVLVQVGTALADGTEVVLPEELVQDHLRRFEALGAAVKAALEPLPARASDGSPAAAAQERVAEVLGVLGGREHSRARYLHARRERMPLMDEVIQAAMEDVFALKAAPDPTNAGWLARLACLPFAPHVTLAALHVLGAADDDAEDPVRAADAIAALPEPRPRRVDAALAHVCALLSEGISYPREVHAQLRARLGPSP
jgi:hypothetical protein